MLFLIIVNSFSLKRINFSILRLIYVYSLITNDNTGILNIVSSQAAKDEENSSCFTNFNTETSYQCGKELRITSLTGPLTLGEEPFWDAETRSLFFVDILKATIHRYSIDSKLHYCTKIGNKYVGAMIPIEEASGDKFLVNYGDQLAILLWNGKSRKSSLQNISTPDPSHPWPQYFLDDAKIAPSSNDGLFFYTVPNRRFQNPLPKNQSTLFGIFDKRQKILMSGLQFGNGLGFSRNGEWLYHSDSSLKITYKSYFDRVANSIKNTSVLLNYVEKGVPGYPDSLTLDKEDYLWVTCNNGSQIMKVDPNSGDILCTIKIPSFKVTNLAFGGCPNSNGDKLNCLYATTSILNLTTPTVYDGSLLLIEGVETEGLLENKAKLKNIINWKLR